jgi:alpha-galactosidase
MSDAALFVVCLLLCLAVCSSALGVTPTADEMAKARRWSAAHFRRPVPGTGTAAAEASPGAGIVVLANHGPVLVNGRGDGRPIQIAEVKYTHGFICHAVSKLLVRLPGPGRAFRATVGVDTNAGGGSIIFGVSVGEREAFRSAVMHCNEPGVPVAVDLAGASEFTVEAGDAGDWIACDHADWAEATVTLQDGTELRLSDLPLISAPLAPRAATRPPFAFRYDGQDSDELLPGWRYEQATERLDAQRLRHTQTYTDPATGLTVRCERVEYADFPVMEWTLHLRNTGDADTPIIEGLQALDTRFGPGQESFLLHHNVGSLCQANDFEPLETSFAPGDTKRISAAGGRPTNSDLCYFNLQWAGAGAIIALGWPGQWAADFQHDGAVGFRVVGGQELTHFRLRPGEEARTPLVALLLWEGDDWLRAQNLWRHWMIAHNLPRPGGELVRTHYGSCFSNMQPHADEEIGVIQGFAREGVKPDYWFLDAGWYPGQGVWWNTGTWEVDRERFPRGLREVADVLHAQDTKFVVWFEPERCAAGSWLAENHPEWVIGGKDGGLVNLGDPEAWQWVLDRVDSLLTSEAIDVYRQDFNIDPLAYWRANDALDRQGITEIKHVMGYLAFWDELLRRHPDLYIDTCASGGRRNDLETLRRSVPLLRSDFFGDVNSQQAQTMGLAPWMPYFGSGMGMGDKYWFRSCIFPASRVGLDTRQPGTDYDFLKRMIAECREVQGFQMGDFHPLTPYSLADDVWVAWQWHRPDLDAGVVQAFRRASCAEASIALSLRGLEPEARYLVTDFDSGERRELSGERLLQGGLHLTASDRPQALLLRYEKCR